MINGKNIAIVLPAYNAEKTLETTVHEIPDIVDTCILVDDNSRDATVDLAHRLGLLVFVHDRNYGYGRNQQTCYREALSAGADVVIMLATVSSRIREIGIRKAIGATNREIRFQFLAEAVLISLIGGILGIVIGLAIPFSVRFFTAYRIPISGLSAIIAILVSSLVGILFGTLPATRAAQLDPVESLRYE